MADSNSSLVISGIAAVAAIGSAVVAVLQASSAKRQAEESASQARHAETAAIAAKAQAEAAGKQVEFAEEQVRLLREQVDQEKFKLVVKPEFQETIWDGQLAWLLVITVENHSKVEANIQRVAVLSSSGLDCEWAGREHTSSGQLKCTISDDDIRLPAKLGPGESGEFTMLERMPFLGGRVYGPLAPIDWSHEKWRPVKGILVRANNKDFLVTEGDWRRQVETEYFKLSPPKGTV